MGIEGLLKTGLDWITKVPAMQVTFASVSMPAHSDSVSLLGKQISSGGAFPFIVPHTYSNGQTTLFLRSGVMDLAGLLHIACLMNSSGQMRIQAGIAAPGWGNLVWVRRGVC